MKLCTAFIACLLVWAVHPVLAQISPCAPEIKCDYFTRTSGENGLDLVLTKEASGQYKRSFPYSAVILELNRDNSFTYCYISYPVYYISTGNYHRTGKALVLDWDSVKTATLAADPKLYGRLFRFKKPEPMRVERALYVQEGEKLVPERVRERSRIEILWTSDDLFGKNKSIDSLRTISYNIHGDKLLIAYGKSSVLEIPAAKVWGFVTFKRDEVEVYRRTPKGFNWYGIPGARISQLDKVVMYTVGNGHTYSYFSTGLDSEIRPLNMKEVQRSFKNDTLFLQKLHKEFGSGLMNSFDQRQYSYRFITLYRESVNN